MNDFKYDELNKKYQDLLEENRYLKAKIKELEAESNVFESYLKTFQTQELLFKETCNKTEPDNRFKEELIENVGICGTSSVYKFIPSKSKY